MKNELDALMQANDIDVLLILGAAAHNPAMVYFTGVVHVSAADLIKKRGEPPVLFCNPMEREEAARTGLITRSYNEFPFMDLLKEANGDRILAAALRYQRMLASLGITSGRMALYGSTEVGAPFMIINALQQLAPGLTFVGYAQDPILMQAMQTKDEAEVARIRRMGAVTTEVVGRVADYLTSQHAKDGVLVNSEGQPVTIGDVKSRIDLWLAEKGAENPEGCIFAIGRDAGVPHSAGTLTDLMRLGQTIVFDIYPCEAGGGYFYDFTRTWCLGYAPDEAQKLYEQVHSVYNTLKDEFTMGRVLADYQKRTCELFEAMGHPTVMTQPTTEEGYVHSLSHGVGLHIHEKPFSGIGMNDLLVPGSIFTSEPGLYYPSRGMGVRIEDTYYARPDGTFEILADFPKELVLPVRQ
ncbi:Xaa-Pro aminopeptidase [Longilinea arvoryzae]|uniref:Xaa-Pro aminopeptidase n=1 Tax=Longilinea arvoryzae TaxID=360412 RepID=A0A0S7BF66_9CHLR|nr:M24 family metallopeptidase [Longilinea arvoryzae]GAP14137.1 Xaa-Pro aminopeptidase [Longilinea arvoryzae]